MKLQVLAVIAALLLIAAFANARPHHGHYGFKYHHKPHHHLPHHHNKEHHHQQQPSILPRPHATAAPYFNISADDLYTLINHNKPQLYIIDVRSEEEWREGHIPYKLGPNEEIPIFNLPLDTLKETIHLLPNPRYFVIHCKGGFRSLQAILTILQPAGFRDLYNLENGFDEWKKYYPVQTEKEPMFPTPAIRTNMIAHKTDYELALEAMGLD